MVLALSGRRKQCPLTGGNLNFCISGLAAIRVQNILQTCHSLDAVGFRECSLSVTDYLRVSAAVLVSFHFRQVNAN